MFQRTGVMAALLIMSTALLAQVSTSRISFNKDWNFYLGNPPGDPKQLNYDAISWRALDLPHDWSVELAFDKESPTGTGGGALRGGLGWYRKVFTVPAEQKGQKLFIDFDGVYMNSEVFINGHSLGVRPNGYISFRYDLSPFINFGGRNVLLVKVDNSQQPNSRWYSGSGIYRNVWLVPSDPVHLAHWGLSSDVKKITKAEAEIEISTGIDNQGIDSRDVKVQITIQDQQGRRVADGASTNHVAANARMGYTQRLGIANPILWSDHRPYLYKIVISVWVNNKLVDKQEAPLGLRYFRFDAEKGFFLNDRHTKIRGVCMHHDLGSLGTAINRSALERQLRILKEMGCNAIRTSHNPPAPDLLELCDRMGFLVMDEAFDMWAKQKTKFDYHLYWNDWHKKDLEDQVLRDRNHPSVIMWSVGNEIPEQWGRGEDSSGRVILRELAVIVRALDPSRPIVTGNNETKTWNNLLQSGVDDVIGYNYHHQEWDSVQHVWGKKPFIVTESVSALQTRGHYDMPSDSIRKWPPAWDKPLLDGNADTTCSAYDNCHAPWGSTHEESLRVMEKYPHISGMFVWTGFDYLGEPTPYPWPARSSYFGIVDLAGFPKDVYYLYQSLWTSKPVLHVFPHWNWNEGQTIDVWAYYNNADEVELYLNGRSLGKRSKKADELHVVWRVKYAAGTLRAISRKKGKTVLVREIKTAGSPTTVSLQTDRKSEKAGSDEAIFISVAIKDRHGNTVPDASNLIKFTVTNGSIMAVDNGSQTSLESFRGNQRKAFKGKCLLIVKPGNREGNMVIQARSDDLKSGAITIPLTK